MATGRGAGAGGEAIAGGRGGNCCPIAAMRGNGGDHIGTCGRAKCRTTVAGYGGAGGYAAGEMPAPGAGGGREGQGGHGGGLTPGGGGEDLSPTSVAGG